MKLKILSLIYCIGCAINLSAQSIIIESDTLCSLFKKEDNRYLYFIDESLNKSDVLTHNPSIIASFNDFGELIKMDTVNIDSIFYDVCIDASFNLGEMKLFYDSSTYNVSFFEIIYVASNGDFTNKLIYDPENYMEVISEIEVDTFYIKSICFNHEWPKPRVNGIIKVVRGS